MRDDVEIDAHHRERTNKHQRRQKGGGRGALSPRLKHRFSYIGRVIADSHVAVYRMCFHDSRAVAEADVLVDSNGRIAETRLGLDRDFISDPVLGASARDIAKKLPLLGGAGGRGVARVPLLAAIEQSAPEGTRKVQLAVRSGSP